MCSVLQVTILMHKKESQNSSWDKIICYHLKLSIQPALLLKAYRKIWQGCFPIKEWQVWFSWQLLGPFWCPACIPTNLSFLWQVTTLLVLSVISILLPLDTSVSFLQEYYVKRLVCLSTPGCSGHILRMTGHVRHATAASLFIQFCLTAAVCGSSVCTEGMSPVTFHFSVSSACHSSDCRTLGNSWIIWSRVCTITAVAEGREAWNLAKEAIQLEPKQRFLIHFFWWQKSVASIKSMKNAI